jgi:hypothetical protein
MKNTKYITRKKSKMKVVMLINDYSFFMKFENEYYYMRHYHDLVINSFEDAYKLIDQQGKYEVGIWSVKDIQELAENSTQNGNDELLNAIKKLIREDKLKQLNSES